MSLPRFVSIGGSSTKEQPVGLVSAQGDIDLLTFLETVQRLDVDFLPSVWRPNLETIGVGGTSQINQSLVSLQTSFAFKRRYEPGKYPPINISKDEKFFYQALTAEITVLGHEPLRDHPNIVNLVGVCWDPTPGNGEVWPVLVTEKSHHGDLLQFSKSAAYHQLKTTQRLALCRDIGSAVGTMHASGVIHGDIKPQNVLVFKGSSGDLNVRVTDFGYSSVFAHAQDVENIQIATSEPWTAPEHWIGREYTVADAKATDIYSYGLLCLWCLYSESIEKIAPSSSYRSYISFDNLKDDDNAIEDFKAEDKMQSLACELVEADKSLNFTQKDELKSLFKACLTTISASRYNPLVTALNPAKTQDSGASSAMIYNTTDSEEYQGFKVTRLTLFLPKVAEKSKIARYIVQLLKSDYRVRSYILGCFQKRATQCPSAKSGKHAAFQCAISYIVGFGAPSDKGEALKWLTRSGKSATDLSDEVMKLRTLESSKLQETSQKMHLLMSSGFNVEMNYAEEFRAGANLRQVEASYRREISDLRAAFGEDHDLIRVLEEVLVLILEELCDLKGAENLRRQHLSVIESRQGTHHHNTLSSIDNLAGNLTKQGRFTEAEELTRQALAQRESTLGRDHLHTLISINNLASLMSRAGKHAEAASMHARVLSGRTKVLGADHPETLGSADYLASALQAQGKYHEAAKMAQGVLEKKQALLGDDHPDTLASMGNLATSLKDIGLHEQSLHLCQETLPKCQKVLGDTNAQTLIAMHNLADVLLETGDHASASVICQRALDINIEVFGLNHLSTTKAKTMFAQVLISQGKYDDAQNLIGQVNKPIGTPEMSKPDTLVVSSVQATIFAFQGRHGEATELQSKVVEGCEELYGKTHMKSLVAGFLLAASLIPQDDLEAASEKAVAVWDGARALLGSRHLLTLKTAGLFGNILHHKGQSQRALETLLPTLQDMREVLGDENIETLKLAIETAAAEISVGRYAAAENLYRKSLSRILEHGHEHPYALSCKHGLGKSISFQGRYAEAEEVLRHVHAKREELLGEWHPDTMHTLRELAVAIGGQGKHDAAERMLRRVASFSAKKWGETHSYALGDAAALTNELQALNQHDEAEVILRQVIRAREASLGPDHPATLNTVNSLASVLQSQARNELAASTYRRVVEASQDQIASGNVQSLPLASAASCNLGNVLLEMGHYAEAEGHLSQAMKGFHEIFGESHQNTTRCMRSLLSVYRNLGRETEAHEMFMAIGRIYESHNLWEKEV